MLHRTAAFLEKFSVHADWSHVTNRAGDPCLPNINLAWTVQLWTVYGCLSRAMVSSVHR